MIQRAKRAINSVQKSSNFVKQTHQNLTLKKLTDMKRKILDEIIGWYGACAIVVAYALVSFNVLSPSTFINKIINATGALGIAYISFKKKAYAPGVLNVIWAIIALTAIIWLTDFHSRFLLH